MTKAQNPVVSDRIVRERTFNIVQLRKDKRDALAQVLVTIDQVLAESKFTGQIVINVAQGTMASLQVKESQKV